ncbi:Nicotinate-nucleotide adenylyltransferase [Bacillus thuringiensis IBL 200]|nr:Nicotinate-nucleotide adenylyltransferase [Bacillus thuringiensis IBL 200]
MAESGLARTILLPNPKRDILHLQLANVHSEADQMYRQ